jgi:hypothetical protein
MADGGFNKECMKMPKDFHFDHVLAVSALNRTGIDEVLSKLQELLRINKI